MTGKRYHVVPGQGKELLVIDNTYIKQYNKQIKVKAHKINVYDLILMAYYSTPEKGITRK
jgi:hypothetical protein